MLDAIAIARRVGMPLCIAAKMREHGERRVLRAAREPLLGPDIEFVGEVEADERERLLGGAVALLNPIDWAEPFGLVMIESMACGTPVIAYPHGAAPEIVRHGTTGFLCDGVAEAADALRRAGRWTARVPAARRAAGSRASRMAGQYVTLYRRVLADARAAGGRDRAVRALLARSHHRRPLSRCPGSACAPRRSGTARWAAASASSCETPTDERGVGLPGRARVDVRRPGALTTLVEGSSFCISSSTGNIVEGAPWACSSATRGSCPSGSSRSTASGSSRSTVSVRRPVPRHVRDPRTTTARPCREHDARRCASGRGGRHARDRDGCATSAVRPPG